MNSQNKQTKELFKDRREQRIVFSLVAIGIFAITFGFFFVIDFLPEKPSEEESEEVTVSVAVASEEEKESVEEIMVAEIDPLPVKIIFDSLDEREVVVLNPQSSAIAALDNALLSGVVRHPDSADFEDTGTIFLFGHSSYLPNVFNKNFQAFNGVQDLKWGDKVRLQSGNTEYVYRVDKVYQVKASDAEVEIEHTESKLTLATCNSFGSKDDRYIVESTLVDSYPIEG